MYEAKTFADFESNNDHPLSLSLILSDSESEEETILEQCHYPTASTAESSRAGASGEEGEGWLASATERLKRAGDAIKDLKNNTAITKKFRTTWNSVKYSGKWMTDHSNEYGKQKQIVLLGRFYAPDGSDGLHGRVFKDFAYDYYSRIWLTYRTNMPPLPGSQVTSDCGWGCMLRSTQMMLAQTIVCIRNFRDSRFRSRKPSVLRKKSSDSTEFTPKSPPPAVAMDMIEHVSIIRLFDGDESSPLGLHKLLCLAAEQNEGRSSVGKWFSASEAVSLMRQAVRESISPYTSDLAVLLCADGHLMSGDVERVSQNWTKNVLIVITLRLGTTSVNKVYYSHIRQLLATKNCVGFIGGKPEHSLYFIGYYGEDYIIYLDPHVAHEYKEFSASDLNSEENPLSSYHCSRMSKMEFSSMDPSCAVGLVAQSAADFHELIHSLNLAQVIDVDLGEGLGEKRTRDPLFAVCHGEERRSSERQEPTDEEAAIALAHGFELL